jgi:hypothetical protein
MHAQLTLHGAEGVPLEAAPVSPVVTRWRGGEARALRLALRMSNVDFAACLGVVERTVVGWNTHPDRVPVPELQRALDTALCRAADPARDRFALALAGEVA